MDPCATQSADHLLTSQNSALVIIDYQPSPIQTVTSIDHHVLTDNVVSVARLAKTFNLPVVLSTVGVNDRGQAPTIPELKTALDGDAEIDRSEINSWENNEFRDAVKQRTAGS
jgi:nicotinamidase-related amidase